MNEPKRFGLSVALSTPFDESGRIDTGRLVEHARWCRAEGCSSVTLFGTTGEGASISLAERHNVFSVLARAGIAGPEIVGGVAVTSVDDAVAQASMALDQDCRAVLLPPPFFFKGVDEEGVFAWYAAVVEGLGARARDILLYNIPSMTAVAMPLTLIERLCQGFPEVFIGVKDSSGDWSYTERLLAAHHGRVILVGDERCLAQAVRAGAQGAISGLANLCPDLLLPLANEGRENPRINRLVDDIIAYPVMAAVKALIAHRRDDAGWVAMRPPLTELAAADRAAVADRFDRIMATPAA
ncbi:dihydrodipicolinate synthase family protein [Chelatococcus sp. GCM10030263]|uniref:dihydrodipicolinate synthase family protein n=1 Tax=Chelatococcus sp. GCM10030263 TaxID=3273387 RepID=UPI00362393C1